MAWIHRECQLNLLPRASKLMFVRVNVKFSGQTRIQIPEAFTGECWLVLNGQVLDEGLDYRREGDVFVLSRALRLIDEIIVTDE